jgi:hypothetical protein
MSTPTRSTAPTTGAATDAPATDTAAETAADAEAAPTRRYDVAPTEPVGASAAEPVTEEPERAERTLPVGEDDRILLDETARRDVLSREREAFGGMKLGSAFFGWLTATGLAVILSAIVAGTGVALGLGEQATNGTAQQSAAIGLGGAIAILAVLFVSYLAGGYVAGRMARFSPLKQGLAVWLWALAVAIVVGVVAAVAGTQYNVLATLHTFPRLPIDEGALTTTGIVVAALAAVVPLVAALLGGLVGMRYHRRVDRVGFGG